MKNYLFVGLLLFLCLNCLAQTEDTTILKQKRFNGYASFHIGNQYFRLADESILNGYQSNSTIINSTLNTSEIFSFILVYTKFKISLETNWAFSHSVYHVYMPINPYPASYHWQNDVYNSDNNYEFSTALLKTIWQQKLAELKLGAGYYNQIFDFTHQGPRIVSSLNINLDKKKRFALNAFSEKRFPDFYYTNVFKNNQLTKIKQSFKRNIYFFIGIQIKLY